MLLNKCSSCDEYTLDKICPSCGKEAVSAHYTSSLVRDAPKGSFRRR